MREELFASGRNIPNIDPYLHIWHWQIPLYLFLGGLAAGILFFAGYYTVTGKADKMQADCKMGSNYCSNCFGAWTFCLVSGFETPALFLATLHNCSTGITNELGSLDIDGYYTVIFCLGGQLYERNFPCMGLEISYHQ